MPVPEVDVEACAAWLLAGEAERPALLDVRTPGEFALAALPNALLVPLHELEEAEGVLEGLHGRRVVVYCHHGVRSLHGAACLQQRGLEPGRSRGGIDAWSLRVDPRVPRY